MKKSLLILAVIFSIAACNSNDKQADENKSGPDSATAQILPMEDSANYTTIEWLDSTFIDMGKIKKGNTVEVSFPFKNTGNKQLVIANVTAGCGCTVPEKPQEPFAPGKEGVIKAKFDSNGQHVGEHIKNVTVTANTAPTTTYVLNFKVEVTE